MTAPAPRPAAVLFDCDGTLVDSEPLARIAWERTLAPHGYALTDEDLEQIIGLPFPVVHAFFARRVALPGPEPVLETLSRELFALYAERLEVFPDVVACVQDLRRIGVPVAVACVRELRRTGVPLAVASSSPRPRLDLALAHVGLADAFAVTVAGDEVARGKPEPDMFLEAARRLGADPAACVVVEDSAPGVAAGLAAGMGVLGVVREHGGAGAVREAHVVVDEVGLDGVLSAAAARPAG